MYSEDARKSYKFRKEAFYEEAYWDLDSAVYAVHDYECAGPGTAVVYPET